MVVLLANCVFVALASSWWELVLESVWQFVGRRVRRARSGQRAHSGSREDCRQNVRGEEKAQEASPAAVSWGKVLSEPVEEMWASLSPVCRNGNAECAYQGEVSSELLEQMQGRHEGIRESHISLLTDHLDNHSEKWSQWEKPTRLPRCFCVDVA